MIKRNEVRKKSQKERDKLYVPPDIKSCKLLRLDLLFRTQELDNLI